MCMHMAVQTLAMNGCSGVTAAMWAGVNGLQKQHALQTLSCVGCKSLRCCWLGLVPARPADDHAQVLPECFLLCCPLSTVA